MTIFERTGRLDEALPAIPMDHSRMELRVYLAADFYRREEVSALADELESRFSWVTVVSRWHRQDTGNVGLGGPDADREAAELVAVRDLEDVDSCDLFAVLTTGQLARGGRHFETGYAYATGKKVVFFGPEEHVFHYLPGVTGLPDEELVAGLTAAVKLA